MNLDLNKLLILCIFVSSSSQLFADDSFILNYEDVDIKKVTQDIAQFSKKTIILDPRVKGKITIYSNAELDRDQVWNVYLRTLQVNGFSIISEEGFVRIIPENEATRDLSIATKTLGDFETVVIPLTNRSADEILPMVKPITGRQAHLSSIPSINSILLVDRGSNVERVNRLILDLDKNNTAKISITKLENLSPIEAVRILDKLKAQNNPTISKFIAIPFSPTNSVIISANDFVTNNINLTLQSLDADVTSDDSVDVIYLKYAKAADISAILSSISSSFIADADGKKTVITHHEKTNSLIISSAEANLDTIKNIISKLDIRRAQVLVEAIIVELSETAAKNLGVELELVPVSSKQRIPFLETDRVDLVISTMGANPERAKSINFSSAYAPFFSGAFAASKLSIKGPSDLAGLKVGLTGGSLEDLEITKIAPKSTKIVRFGDNAATLSAFTSKQVDVLVSGNTAAAALSAEDPNLDIQTKFIIKESPCFIGVKKGNEDLLRWVNVFILHKKLGGELNAISQKWLGQDLPPLPSL